MARIGNEIRPHLLEASLARPVREHEQEPPAIGERRLKQDRGGNEVALHRHGQRYLSRLRPGSGKRAVDRRTQRRVAQERCEVGTVLAEQRTRCRVQRHRLRIRAEHHERVGQACDDANRGGSV